MITQERLLNLAHMPTDQMVPWMAFGEGRTWTLTTLLGKFLAFAQEDFGPRQLDWTILGVEFGSGPTPHIFYPQPGQRYVVVTLGASARVDLRQAIFHLAHETIHLLAPSGASDANHLEEGLATLFSMRVMSWCQLDPLYPSLASYAAAAEDVAHLLRLDDGALRRLRIEDTSFSSITPSRLQKAVPQASSELVSRLCGPFVRG